MQDEFPQSKTEFLRLEDEFPELGYEFPQLHSKFLLVFIFTFAEILPSYAGNKKQKEAFMPLIQDNNFSKDAYALRGARLSLLSGNITPFSAELGLTLAQTDWALASFQAFLDAQSTAQLERGDKDLAQEQYQVEFDEAYQHYLRIKELLLAMITDSEQDRELAEGYGIAGRAPQNYSDMCTYIDTLIDKHDLLVTAGDTRIAPQTAVDLLAAKKVDLVKAFNTIGVEKQESAKAYDDLHALYTEDTQQLRVIYQIATLIWGKASPNLIAIGYAPAKPRPGGGQPDAPVNFAHTWVSPDLSLSWQECENTTSYQLAYSTDNELWEELYSGDQLSHKCEPPIGKRWYKVRARNSNGFSNWSNTVSYERMEEPPE
jgi:hypothetical protein